MLTPPGRSEPQAPPAPGILAAAVAELPELDGAVDTRQRRPLARHPRGRQREPVGA
jgi:hypothetical protein